MSDSPPAAAAHGLPIPNNVNTSNPAPAPATTASAPAPAAATPGPTPGPTSTPQRPSGPPGSVRPSASPARPPGPPGPGPGTGPGPRPMINPNPNPSANPNPNPTANPPLPPSVPSSGPVATLSLTKLLPSEVDDPTVHRMMIDFQKPPNPAAAASDPSQWTGFSPFELRILSQILCVVKVEAGEKLHVKGENASFIAVVLRGAMDAVDTETGAKSVVNQGDWVGESEYYHRDFSLKTRKHDLIAKGTSLVGLMPYQEIRGFSLAYGTAELMWKLNLMWASNAIRKAAAAQQTQPKQEKKEETKETKENAAESGATIANRPTAVAGQVSAPSDDLLGDLGDIGAEIDSLSVDDNEPPKETKPAQPQINRTQTNSKPGPAPAPAAAPAAAKPAAPAAAPRGPAVPESFIKSHVKPGLQVRPKVIPLDIPLSPTGALLIPGNTIPGVPNIVIPLPAPPAQPAQPNAAAPPQNPAPAPAAAPAALSPPAPSSGAPPSASPSNPAGSGSPRLSVSSVSGPPGAGDKEKSGASNPNYLLQSARNKVTKLETEIDSKDKQIQSMEAELKSLKDAAAARDKSERQENNREKGKIQAELSEEREKSSKAIQELTEWKAKYHSIESRWNGRENEFKEEKKRLEQAIEEWKAKHAKELAENQRLQSDFQKFQAEIAKERELRASTASEAEKAMEASKAMQQLRSDYEKLQAERSSEQNEVKQEKANAERWKAKSEEYLGQWQNERGRMRRRLNKALEACESMKKDVESYKILLKYVNVSAFVSSWRVRKQLKEIFIRTLTLSTQALIEQGEAVPKVSNSVQFENPDDISLRFQRKLHAPPFDGRRHPILNIAKAIDTELSILQESSELIAAQKHKWQETAESFFQRNLEITNSQAEGDSRLLEAQRKATEFREEKLAMEAKCAALQRQLQSVQAAYEQNKREMETFKKAEKEELKEKRMEVEILFQRSVELRRRCQQLEKSQKALEKSEEAMRDKHKKSNEELEEIEKRLNSGKQRLAAWKRIERAQMEHALTFKPEDSQTQSLMQAGEEKDRTEKTLMPFTVSFSQSLPYPYSATNPRPPFDLSPPRSPARPSTGGPSGSRGRTGKLVNSAQMSRLTAGVSARDVSPSPTSASVGSSPGPISHAGPYGLPVYQYYNYHSVFFAGKKARTDSNLGPNSTYRSGNSSPERGQRKEEDKEKPKNAEEKSDAAPAVPPVIADYLSSNPLPAENSARSSRPRSSRRAAATHSTDKTIERNLDVIKHYLKGALKEKKLAEMKGGNGSAGKKKKNKENEKEKEKEQNKDNQTAKPAASTPASTTSKPIHPTGGAKSRRSSVARGGAAGQGAGNTHDFDLDENYEFDMDDYTDDFHDDEPEFSKSKPSR